MMKTLTFHMALKHCWTALRNIKENGVSRFWCITIIIKKKTRLAKNYSVTLDLNNTEPKNTAVLDQEKKICSIPFPNPYVMGCSSWGQALASCPALCCQCKLEVFRGRDPRL